MATNKRRKKAASKDPKKPDRKKKRDYHIVDDSQRELLIKTVQEGKISIRKAALKLDINYSTAKHIMRHAGGTISPATNQKNSSKSLEVVDSDE